jgi:nitrate/TMAO reductase-like tetraheme cytochrome c subunit
MIPNERSGWRTWVSPLIHLSNNSISLAGVVIVTTATIFWLFLLPTTFAGEVEHPYMGILAFMALPALLLLGLGLIPIGMWFRRKREGRIGIYPSHFPPLTWRNRDLRRLVLFILLTTFVNLAIASQVTYGAVVYMESVNFCGTTCHVMQPEFTAYQNSPHSRVECVKCHVGPGAAGFIHSKLSGVRQVIAVFRNSYQRPIPAPVHDLRPARETCEACHWPQKYGEDRIRVITKYADDEANTPTKTVLLMKIGGGNGGVGIHGTHLGPGVKIRYAHADEARQTIPWIEYAGPGRKTVYATPEAKPDGGGLPVREMDCIDCHNRPSHKYELPDRAVDTALRAGEIPADLPFIKKQSLAVLQASYASRADAARRIPAGFEAYYRDTHQGVYTKRQAEIKSAAQRVLEIYNRNVFPDMNVKWGAYPNNIGHMDFPGCYRCHDEKHAEPGGRTISQDCNSCHNLLAMDEADPKVLTDLGIAESKPTGEK